MVYDVNRGQNMSQGNYIQVNDQGTFLISHTQERDSFYQNRDLKQTAENRSVPRVQKIRILLLLKLSKRDISLRAFKVLTTVKLLLMVPFPQRPCFLSPNHQSIDFYYFFKPSHNGSLFCLQLRSDSVTL